MSMGTTLTEITVCGVNHPIKTGCLLRSVPKVLSGHSQFRSDIEHEREFEAKLLEIMGRISDS